MPDDLYLLKIRSEGNWIWDLEVSVVYLIYDYFIYNFEIKNKQELIKYMILLIVLLI